MPWWDAHFGIFVQEMERTDGSTAAIIRTISELNHNDICNATRMIQYWNNNGARITHQSPLEIRMAPIAYTLDDDKDQIYFISYAK